MDEVRGMLKLVFRTADELTFPVSGTGTARAWKTCLVNLIEPGDEVVVCVRATSARAWRTSRAGPAARSRLLDAKWGEGFEPARWKPLLQEKERQACLCIVQARRRRPGTTSR